MYLDLVLPCIAFTLPWWRCLLALVSMFTVGLAKGSCAFTRRVSCYGEALPWCSARTGVQVHGVTPGIPWLRVYA